MIAFILIFLFNPVQAEEESELYRQVFKGFDRIEQFKIPDPINDEPTNLILLGLYQGQKLLGYAREITTTTGCNSACLPLVYTTFYSPKGDFVKLLSRDGLTKKNHVPLTPEDYATLEMIVLMAPEKFNHVKHPKEMTDALSGATIKAYQDIVVKEAAYTTLRVHLYNQQTIKAIKSKQLTLKIKE